MAVSSCGRTTLGVLVEGLLVVGVDAIAAKRIKRESQIMEEQNRKL